MPRKIVEKGKALIQSKVFWFNVLSVVIAVASLFGFEDFKPSTELTSIIATVTAVVNVLLRIKTSEPITRIK